MRGFAPHPTKGGFLEKAPLGTPKNFDEPESGDERAHLAGYCLILFTINSPKTKFLAMQSS